MAEYRLLDFGGGRKLEAIGDLVFDRPCPAAEGFPKRFVADWQSADSKVLRGDGRDNWHHRRSWPRDLAVNCGAFEMPVEPTPFGHIGLFPEQRPNWLWIRDFVDRWHRDLIAAGDVRKLRVLNLFAYTGASTLAAASSWHALVADLHSAESPAMGPAMGPVMEVVHVDAAKPNVEAAKRAAAWNALGASANSPVERAATGKENSAALPSRAAAEREGRKRVQLEHRGLVPVEIRFMVDDARKFVARELRRRRMYDLIILDPPAYGHGGKGSAWRLERDFRPLLEDCLQLFSRDGRDENSVGGPRGLLITGHTEGYGPSEIRRWLQMRLTTKWREDSGRAGLEDRAGRILDAGFYMRVQWE